MRLQSKQCQSRVRGCGWLMLIVLLLTAQVGAKEQVRSDWGVRATLLMTLAYLTKWPPEILPQPNSPLIIGVLGQDAESAQLLRALQEKIARPEQKVKLLKQLFNRDIQVRACANTAEAERCHIVYVSFTEKDDWPQILRSLQDKTLITIGETEEFARLGGAMSFREGETGRVFWGNLDQVKRLQRENIVINSELLEPPYVTFVRR